jgi:hypothetical protein
MGIVINFWEWKAKRREQLGYDPVRAYQRHSRRGRGKGSKPTTTGLDLSAELHQLLSE